jgi:hypothetical protein
MAQGHRSRIVKLALAAIIVAAWAGPALAANCGGSERWPVKVASDPEAVDIDTANVIDINIADFNKLLPSEAIANSDEFDRMQIEKRVYRIHGFVALYKLEPDGDYHLAIADATARVTRGGRKTRPTGHSFVAEIPRPKCFAGKYGEYPATSRFPSEIAATRQAFEQGVAGVNARRISPGSIPATMTGVVFFDFDHGQVGRGKSHKDANGKRLVIELHPILSIAFGE